MRPFTFVSPNTDAGQDGFYVTRYSGGQSDLRKSRFLNALGPVHKAIDDNTSKYYWRDQSEITNLPIGLEVTKDGECGQRYSLLVMSSMPLVGVSLQYYPACCGMAQLNNFMYESRVFDEHPQSFFNILDYLMETVGYREEKRWVVNLVHLKIGHREMSSEELENRITNESGRQRSYPLMHDWVHSKKVESRSFHFNRNSDNTIEHVIFKL